MTDLDDLKVLARRIPQARQRMLENLPGYGTHADGPSSGHGDRTVSLALKATMATDPAVRDLARLTELQAELKGRVECGRGFHHQLGELKTIIDRWAPLPKWLENIRRNAGKGQDGCRSCARYKTDQGPAWGDIHGRGMCKFCIRAVSRVAGLYEWDEPMPPVGVVEWHHRTGKYLSDDVIHRVMFGKPRRD